MNRSTLTLRFTAFSFSDSHRNATHIHTKPANLPILHAPRIEMQITIKTNTTLLTLHALRIEMQITIQTNSERAHASIVSCKNCKKAECSHCTHKSTPI